MNASEIEKAASLLADARVHNHLVDAIPLAFRPRPRRYVGPPPSGPHAVGDDILTRYTCPAGRSVGLYLVKDNGHAWTDGQKGRRRGDQPSMAFDTTDNTWAFFSALSK